jgi:hypothetical protein
MVRLDHDVFDALVGAMVKGIAAVISGAVAENVALVLEISGGFAEQVFVLG